MAPAFAEESHPKLTMDASGRPQVKVLGISRNPEYNINSGAKRFARREDGRRIAPVSQLNTYTGRALANCTPSVPPHSGPLVQQSHTTHQDHQPSIQNKGVSSKEISDRERLPSQRPRTELSQILGMTRGSSRKGTTQGRLASDTQAPKSVACSKCERSGPVDMLRPSNGESHICNACHRFVPVPQLTALNDDASTGAEIKGNPVPPSKYPTGLVCATCISIPGYLYQEYLQFFPNCPCCGHMTDMALSDLIANEGEVSGLRDENGRRLSGPPSKELQDWCVYIAHHARSVSRHNSGRSIASSTSSLGLRRSGAVRRTPTGSTGSSVSGGSGHPGLTLAAKMDVSKPLYTRRFSFTTIELPGLADPSQPGPVKGVQPADGQPQLVFQEKKRDSNTSSLRTSSTEDTVLEYPAVIQHLMSKDPPRCVTDDLGHGDKVDVSSENGVQHPSGGFNRTFSDVPRRI